MITIKFRYIEQENIPTDHYMGLWEFFYTVDEPLIVKRKTKGKVLQVSGRGIDITERYKNLPDDLPIARMPTDKSKGGGLLINEQNIGYQIIVPSSFKDSLEVYNYFIYAILITLRKKGVKCFRDGNDLKFKHNGFTKKFSGGFLQKCKDRYIATRSLSFNPPLKTMRQVYDFTSRKFTKKKEFDDISEIVGGLNELGIYQDVVPDIFNFFLDNTGVEITHKPLTYEERNLIREFKNKRNNKDWILYGKEVG